MKKIATPTRMQKDIGDQPRYPIKASEVNVPSRTKSASESSDDEEIVKKSNSEVPSDVDNLNSAPAGEILLFDTLLSSVVAEPMIGELSGGEPAHELTRNTSSAGWSSSEGVHLMAQARTETWPQTSPQTSASAVVADSPAGTAATAGAIIGSCSSLFWMGIGGLALAGMAGGGFNSGSGSGPNKTIVSGTLVAGPVIAGHTLKVAIYAANGSTKIGEAALDESGKFSVNVGTYTGVIIAKVVNTGTGNDYLDEAWS